MTPMQASKEIARLDKENRSERFSVIDAERMPPRLVNAVVKETDRQGNRAIIIGNSKEILGKAPEHLGRNILDMSKHPEITNQKGEMVATIALDNAKKTVDKIFTKLESSGSITEINGKETLIKQAMQEFSGKIELGKTTILADKYTDKIALHNAIREELKSQGQSGGIDTAINITTKAGQQKMFMVDAAEHGIGPAVVSAMVSAIKDSGNGRQGHDVGMTVLTSDKATLKEQVLQALSKGIDTRTQEQKYIEVPKEQQQAMERTQQHHQQQRTRDYNQMEIGG
jgi:hypothetical protein